MATRTKQPQDSGPADTLGGGKLAWSGSAPPQPAGSRAWLKLPQITTVILLTLLVAVVAVVGGVFFFSTRSMLQTSQAAQVSSFAYGLAATLGDMDSPNRNVIQIQLDAIDKTPNLEFVVLTDTNGRQLAGFMADKRSWDQYRKQLE